jgi:hypothetical protein
LSWIASGEHFARQRELLFIRRRLVWPEHQQTQERKDKANHFDLTSAAHFADG